MGLYIFSFCTLLNCSSKAIRNVSFAFVILYFFFFININSEIMKVWSLGFYGERQMQGRLLNVVEQNPNFNPQGEYITMNFGKSHFRNKFFYGNIGNQKIPSVLLEEDFICDVHFGSLLFFDAWYNPVVIGLGMFGKDNILKMAENKNDKIGDKRFWYNPAEKKESIRYWLYNGAKVGYGPTSVYVDDKFMIMTLDKESFYRNREIFLRVLE